MAVFVAADRMSDLVLDAARTRFLRGGRAAVGDGEVRAEVLASWERSATPGPAPFVGHHGSGPLAAAAHAVLGGLGTLGGVSVGLIEDDVVRVRVDGDRALAELLDTARWAPGHRLAEDDVGTTAAAVARHERRPTTVRGPEHLAPDLRCLAETAAPVGDGAAVVVVTHASDPGAAALALAVTLAARIAEHDRDDRHRRVLAVHEAAAAAADRGAPWVLTATDAEVVLGHGVRALGPPDQQSLHDALTAGVLLGDTGAPRHLDLASGRCAEVVVSEIRDDGVVVGSLLAGRPVERHHPDGPPDDADREARRRQGSHVAPTARRDFAADLAAHHEEARLRASQELFSPYERARRDLTTHLGQRRHLLVVGETGTGKRTLVRERFAHLHPAEHVVVVDCGAVGAVTGEVPDLDRSVGLVLLEGLQALTPLTARRLDEALRPLTAMAGRAVVVGTLDSASVDAGRPYGLLLRHFHETVRVPALRYRSDDLAEITRSVLRSMSGARSLRLSHQVVRVLEGYAWPGNIAELEDVLRYVVARKPVGVIQAPDLPALCFTRRAPKLSMLETAQADAIIQALYESNGNRYQAAARLGIARSSLYRKIDAFGISYIA